MEKKEGSFVGSKYYHLNIFHGGLDALRAAYPQYGFYQVTPHWVTAVSQSFSWGRTQPAAKAVSQETGLTVLSTEYFDDDYAEFAVYQGGKLLTRHVPKAYEDLPRKKANVKKLLDAFQMDLLDEAPLKKALSVTDCAQSAALLESFLGCPICGVSTDAPPIDAPDRRAADQLRSGKSEVSAHKYPNPARKDRPPYRSDIPSQHPAFHSQTICCFTDEPEKILKKLRRTVDMVRKDHYDKIASQKASLAFWESLDPASPHLEDERRELAALEAADPFADDRGRPVWLHALLLPGRVCIQGMSYGAADACAPDFDREFHSMTALCNLFLGDGADWIDFALSYGGKVLCHGLRGRSPSSNHVIPDLVLESPWLSLPLGALVEAFERPDLLEAVGAMEDLLGVKLTPFALDTMEPVEGYGCLTVYRLR